MSLAVSNEILFEYTEIIARQLNSSIADNLLRLLLNLPTLKLINVYFKWQLITADPDDNKFTDTAIAAQADYLVTNDRHFQVAKNIPFPIVNIVTADECSPLHTYVSIYIDVTIDYHKGFRTI